MSTTTRGWLINQLKGVIVVETWIDECRDEIFSNDLRQFLRRYLSRNSLIEGDVRPFQPKLYLWNAKQ